MPSVVDAWSAGASALLGGLVLGIGLAVLTALRGGGGPQE
jgi:hypothetical protein